jgi:hypothetical protein
MGRLLHQVEQRQLLSQFNHALRIGASYHINGDFNRTVAIRMGPVSHVTRE